MAAANVGGLQPDFRVIATSLNEAATHLGRCANVPAIAGVQAILDALQRMETRLNTRIDGVEARLNTRMDGIETRIDGIETRIDDVEARLNTRMDGIETRLNTRMDGIETRLNTRMDGIETRLNARIDQLEVRVVAADQNSLVRQQNKFFVKSPEYPIEPLHSVLTGHPVPNFPNNTAEVDRLTVAQADAILRELGAGMHGGIREKRKRIRALCGVRPVI